MNDRPDENLWDVLLAYRRTLQVVLVLLTLAVVYYLVGAPGLAAIGAFLSDTAQAGLGLLGGGA